MAYSQEQLDAIADLKRQNVIAPHHIENAKKVDLKELMERDGYVMEPDGSKAFTVRLSKKGPREGSLFKDRHDGTWRYLADGIDGNKTMTVIQYAQHKLQCNFPTAIRYLDPSTPDLVTFKKGGAIDFKPKQSLDKSISREPSSKPKEKIIIAFENSPTEEGDEKCWAYCSKRGISDSTIQFALDHNVIDFGVSNKDKLGRSFLGVRFQGFDNDGNLRNGETRALSDKRYASTAADSDKSYCPVLPGDEKEVHIVEGGFDGLGLIDLCKRHNISQPTIIITGGNNNAFIENEKIKPILEKAEKIIIWAERERNDDPDKQLKKQQETDDAHKKQKELMIEAGIDKEKIYTNKPRGEYKDLAEKNLAEHLQELEAKEAEERLVAQGDERADQSEYALVM
jgi:hypothetical protein